MIEKLKNNLTFQLVVIVLIFLIVSKYVFFRKKVHYPDGFKVNAIIHLMHAHTGNAYSVSEYNNAKVIKIKGNWFKVGGEGEVWFNINNITRMSIKK